jgi:hypothetical protein
MPHCAFSCTMGGCFMTKLKMALTLLALLAMTTHSGEIESAAISLKLAKLDIICLPDGSSGFVTTVFCTQGSAKLTPVSLAQVDVTDGATGLKL